MSSRRLLAVPVIVGIVALLSSAGAPASVPESSSVTVPTTAGSTVRDAPAWGGTAPAGVDQNNDCTPEAAPGLNDVHTITVNVPAGVYDTLDATFKFNITWTPPAAAEAADLILTVVKPDGEDLASSDGGSPTETVTGVNLPAGNYKMVVCGFANPLPQQYDGKLEITTAPKEPSLPSAPTQGLAFSAAVAADNQRDESEPLIEIDKEGNMYGCGPTGSSQGSDYHQVSVDGGDQFHLIGLPPRGQAAAGGGGDCAMATGPTASGGDFPYAYAGLGPLTGFTTSISPDNGHRVATAGGDLEGGVTNQGGVADRQWNTFLDDNNTVLMIYNQQAPRNTVVIKSTNGGLTFDTVHAAKGARNPRFPGPIRYIQPNAAYPNGVAYFAWDRAGDDGDHINLSISQDRGATWTDCVVAVAPGNTGLFATADHDTAGNIYVAYNEQARFHTYVVSLTADKVKNCNESVDAKSTLPTANPGFSAPVQADRGAVRTTVFPWLVAGGAPGRVAVEFVGSETDGNPNSGTFKASWDIYVSQSLNMLDAAATFAQVKVTTHPFHYDSICLNGLGCDLAVPPGDRSMADFFAIDVQPGADGKLAVIFDRTNKKPDEAGGHVASPMVAVQIGGPSNGGGTVSSTRTVVRSSSTDPGGDALSNWTAVAPAVLPPAPATLNEAAADFVSVAVGPEIDLHNGSVRPNGGFTLTMKVADLSSEALSTTATRTASQSLLWVWRFTNGYQDAAVSARWNAAQGFSFGFNDYTVAAAQCASSGEKCLQYPGDTPLQGDVNQSTGTIRISVPRHLLRALTGGTGPGQRPTEAPAKEGDRFYDGTAFSLGNASPLQAAQSFLYPLDNTPSMDFLLPSAAAGTDSGCRVNGSGTIQLATKFTIDVHANLKGMVDVRDSSVDFRAKTITKVQCPSATTIKVEGSGFDGSDSVTFNATAVDGGENSASDSFSITLSNGKSRGGPLTQGNVQVRK